MDRKPAEHGKLKRLVSETRLDRALGQRLKALGCLYFKFVSPGNTGVPDRIVILPGGGVVFAELKADGGELSPVQRHQIARLRKQGCRACVVRGRLGVEAFIAEVFSGEV